MKDLLSKDYYCYKINALLVKSMTTHSFYIQPSYLDYPAFFIRKTCLLPVYDFKILLSFPMYNPAYGSGLHMITHQ